MVDAAGRRRYSPQASIGIWSEHNVSENGPLWVERGASVVIVVVRMIVTALAAAAIFFVVFFVGESGWI